MANDEFTKGVICAVAIALKCEGVVNSTIREMYGAVGCPNSQRLRDLGVDDYDIYIITPYLYALGVKKTFAERLAEKAAERKK